MSLLHPWSEYNEKDNTVEINDLAESIRRTEGYRADKVLELRREQELLVRRIRLLKEQKLSYLRQTGILSSQEDSETTMPVDYLNDFDLPENEMMSDANRNRDDVLRNPTDPVLNYIRTNFRQYMPEIDKRVRDYDYRLLKLSLREQKLREDVLMMMQRESVTKETNFN